MKGTYLAQLEKMIDDVKDFKKQKNIQTKNQFKFDEIQKKLTLLVRKEKEKKKNLLPTLN